MKKIIIAAIVLITAGCYTAKEAAVDKTKTKHTTKKTQYVSYKYKIIAPKESPDMTFEDSVLGIKFTITDKEIDFSLKNKSTQPIKIAWDDASMVVYGASKKIMHNGIKYNERNNSMPPTTVLPNSTLSDLALPSDNVYFKEGYYSTSLTIKSSWETYPLMISSFTLPRDSTLLNSINQQQQEMTLYLPITGINNERFGYTFKFQVTDVILK